MLTNVDTAFVFFFQAEDGIRDRTVTGVQTCALPISIFFGSRVLAAGSMSVRGVSPLPPLVSWILVKTFPTASASLASSPIPPMCMNMTLGLSQKKWLWSAVTSSPLSSATLITGLTWSSRRTMSPMTTVWFPALLKAAQDVSPIGGVSFTPAAVTERSARGTETLNTPSFSSSLPFAPVSCSIRAVSSRGPEPLLSFGAALAGVARAPTSKSPRIRSCIFSLLNSSRCLLARFQLIRALSPMGYSASDLSRTQEHPETQSRRDKKDGSLPAIERPLPAPDAPHKPDGGDQQAEQHQEQVKRYGTPKQEEVPEAVAQAVPESPAWPEV